MNDPITVHSKPAQRQCKAGNEQTDGQQVTGPSDLAGMIATLCSYDRFFGPCHIQTLSLTARVAEALWRSGDTGTARGLLDRSIRDLLRSAGRTHAVRLTALSTSRDLELHEGDTKKVWPCSSKSQHAGFCVLDAMRRKRSRPGRISESS